ncbi:hypothetical protein ACFDTO_27690 [Microbacteriaceae bacterium 4G12]
MKRLLLFVLSLSFLFAYAIPHVSACSCMQVTVEDAFAKSAAVFEGKVIKKSKWEDGGQSGDAVLFEVQTNYKGADTSQVIVYTPWSSCGIPFRQGNSYLVYASKDRDQLHTSACTRTTELTAATTDISTLKQITHAQQPKQKVNLEKSMPGHTNLIFIYIGIGLALVLVIAIFLFRRMRK